MTIEVISIITLSEFLVAFMLSFVIALNSKRASAKVLSLAIFLLMIEVGLNALEKTDYSMSISKVRASIDEGDVTSINSPTFLKHYSIFLVYYGREVLLLALGLFFIVSFILMFRDNLPVEIERYRPSAEEKYYWK